MNASLQPGTREHRSHAMHARRFVVAAATSLLLLCASTVGAKQKTSTQMSGHSAPTVHPSNPTPAPKHPPQAHLHPPQPKALSHAPMGTTTPLVHKSPHVYTATQGTPHAPTGPGPMHTTTHAASGGMSAGAKQSLNTQPIPPGRSMRRLPPAGAPHQNDGH